MKGLIYSKQEQLFNKKEIIGYGDKDFFVKIIDKNIANNIIIKNHYSKKIYSNSYIHLGLYIDSVLKGVLQLGYALNPASCKSLVKNTKINEYLELNRMWVCDTAGKNTESRAISYSIKYIRNKFPLIKWIQSFADERCNLLGIVYQASNFKYYGEHKTVFWELDNVFCHNIIMTNGTNKSKNSLNLKNNKDKAVMHTLRQFRYIYWIKLNEIKNCLLSEKPYPKHYIEKH